MPGFEDCSCTNLGKCDTGLICVNNLCVETADSSSVDSDTLPKGNDTSGTDDSAQNSDSDEFNGATDGEGNLCETIELTSTAIPNRVMILQDLSSSLKWNGRWDQLKAGMVNVLEAYRTKLAWGVVPFATTVLDGGYNDADCTVNREHIISPRLESEDSIEELVYTLDSGDLVGGTPTYDALIAGRDILVDEDPGDGSKKYMILVTDGLPNCLDGNGGGGSTAEDVARVTGVMSSLHDDAGITIFTIGYDMTASALESMNTWAELGGTEQVYLADNTESLLKQMETISNSLASCDFTLDSKIVDPEYVRVQVDGKTLPYDARNGWKLGADGSTIYLQQDACEALRDGDEHSVSVKVECTIVIV